MAHPRCALFILALVVGCSSAASSIGVMESAIEGSPLGPMELTSADVQVRIQDRLAITRVDQVFSNPTELEVEGIYTFQLPPGAIITDLVLSIGDRRVQGQIMEAVEARQIYDEIVGRRIDPALVERISDELFRLSVFPFPPHGSRRVEIEYMQVLDASSGVTHYDYPLAPEVMEATVGTFQISVEVESQIEFDVSVSPPYDDGADIERSDARQASILFGEENWSPERDFSLQIEEREILLRPRVLSYPPTAESMGYYVMWMPPVPQLFDAEPLPRRVTFIVDISGSMGGAPLTALRNALADMLVLLEPADLFNIVVFSTQAYAYSADLLPGTDEETTAAAAFVRRLEAGGTTNFKAALETAYSQLDPALPHSVVFLTDGQVNDPLAELSSVVDTLGGPEIRLFTIGVGEGVNTGFLTQLATQHGGESSFVASESGLEENLRTLFDVFSERVMVAANLEFRGTLIMDVHPPDDDMLNVGREMFQVGRYVSGGDAQVVLTGVVAGEGVSQEYPVTLAEDGSALDVIPRLWAYEKVQSLERQILRTGDSELSDDILNLGLAYRLVTSRTALFAPDEDVVVNPEPEEESGPAATAIEDEAGTAGMQFWLGHFFRLDGNRWVDLDYRPGTPLVTVSNTGQLPGPIAPFASVGADLIVVYDGVAYEVLASRLPQRPALLPNAPNPFNPATAIRFIVPIGAAAEDRSLTVFDVSGQVVWTTRVQAALGQQSVTWAGVDQLGRPVATGVYIVRLRVGDMSATRRVTLVR